MRSNKADPTKDIFKEIAFVFVLERLYLYLIFFQGLVFVFVFEKLYDIVFVFDQVYLTP